MPSQDRDFEPDANATRASLFGRLRAASGPERKVAWDEFQARYAPLIAGFAARCVNNVHQAKTRMTKLLKEMVQRLREQEDSG